MTRTSTRRTKRYQTTRDASPTQLTAVKGGWLVLAEVSVDEDGFIVNPDKWED